MLEYFDRPANFMEKVETATKTDWKEFASNLPTLQWFCAKIKIDRDIFNAWINDALNDDYKGEDREEKIEFYNTYKKCLEMQESIWIENSLKGLYSTSFSTFVGKNIFGWKDKSELIERNISDSEKAKKEVYKALKKRIDKMDTKEIDEVIVDMMR